MRALIVTSLVLVSLAGCVTSDSDGEADVPAPTTTIDPETLGELEFAFQVLDAEGNFVREAAWRVAPGTGNCCENYVHVNAEGRIFDFGGTFIHYSDDDGVTWETVPTTIPYRNGEGAIVSAPGGDVVGIGWDPYSGDQVYAHKYEADTGEWSDSVVPVKTPFWDREWIVALPGPFTIDGEEVEYVTFARGGTGYKEVLLVSYDGLNYEEVPTPADGETLAADPTTLAALDADPDPLRDWNQPLRQTLIFPMGDGRGIHMDLAGGASDPVEYAENPSFLPVDYQPGIYTEDGWSPLELTEATLEGNAVLMDSVGTLHGITTHREDRQDNESPYNSFTYHISHDGGRTWEETTWTLPNGYTINDWDFKANAALDQALVNIHAAVDNPDYVEPEPGEEAESPPAFGQDLVYRFNGLDGVPQFQEILLVGDGQAEVGGGGVSNQGDRFDFSNVAMLPDGRIVVSMQDSRIDSEGVITSSNQDSSISPALAIELPLAS